MKEIIIESKKHGRFIVVVDDEDYERVMTIKENGNLIPEQWSQQ